MSTTDGNMPTGEQKTVGNGQNFEEKKEEIQTPVTNGGKEDRVDREDKQGGKRKSKRKPNKFLKAWTSFVAKVQKEEGIAKYSDAIKRAKVRKDKGEKWMGGQGPEMGGEPVEGGQNEMGRQGGRRQRKTNKRSRKQRRNSSKR
jgi:hypothetical protein